MKKLLGLRAIAIISITIVVSTNCFYYTASADKAVDQMRSVASYWADNEATTFYRNSGFSVLGITVDEFFEKDDLYGYLLDTLAEINGNSSSLSQSANSIVEKLAGTNKTENVSEVHHAVITIATILHSLLDRQFTDAFEAACDEKAKEGSIVGKLDAEYAELIRYRTYNDSKYAEIISQCFNQIRTEDSYTYWVGDGTANNAGKFAELNDTVYSNVNNNSVIASFMEDLRYKEGSLVEYLMILAQISEIKNAMSVDYNTIFDGFDPDRLLNQFASITASLEINTTESLYSMFHDSISDEVIGLADIYRLDNINQTFSNFKNSYAQPLVVKSHSFDDPGAIYKFLTEYDGGNNSNP